VRAHIAQDIFVVCAEAGARPPSVLARYAGAQASSTVQRVAVATSAHALRRKQAIAGTRYRWNKPKLARPLSGSQHRIRQMVQVRVATFNVENLFSRPSFVTPRRPEDFVIGTVNFAGDRNAELAKQIHEASTSDVKCQLTARALVATGADIIALQEVDNRAALEAFYEGFVKPLIQPIAAREIITWIRLNKGASDQQIRNERRRIERRHYFDHRVLIEGNDGRGIDVALIARHPITRVTSHAHKTFDQLGIWSDDLNGYEDFFDGEKRRVRPLDRVFKRDCLEVDLEVDGAPLTVFVCHFKSMSPSRAATRAMREAEARAVRKIVEQRFHNAPHAAWIICGDLNDYTEIDGDPQFVDLDGRTVRAGIGPLLDPDFATDVALRITDPKDRWTQYYPKEDSYTRLDYLLLSPALAAANPAVAPEILRAGQPERASRYMGARYGGIGWSRPKASDHCPVTISLSIPEKSRSR
jgi:endonuclease/exonuclease/phosphatase family metal-dependent hydrolase